MVHIISILNLTRYETQVNRQWINIILKELMKSNEDIRALFNITKPTSYTSTSSEHRLTPQSNARKPQRLFTFHEAVSKSCTRIHRHCHHWYPNTTPDTHTRPPADAVPDRIRTTS